MSTTKNTTIALSMLLLLCGFTVATQNYAYAASEKMDVCDELDKDTVEVDDSNLDDENDAQDQCEKAESIKLANEAKITEAQASKTATANNPGRGPVTEILLARDEDDAGVSRIVYEIELTSANGTQTDVKVDAQSGKYLGVDTEDDEDKETNDDATSVVAKDTQSLQIQLISLLQQLIALLKA